jgi:two-component sensor histidine kinase
MELNRKPDPLDKGIVTYSRHGERQTVMTEMAFTPTISEQALLQELNHRISNEFQSALSLVSLTAARSRSQEVKDALSGVTVLLHHYAEIHQALQVPHDRDRVDGAEYLRRLCLSIRRSKFERGQVHLVLAAPPLVLHSVECWLLGLIVYELITNAARHAFHGRNGKIQVELLRAGVFVHCKVMDNGSAPAPVQRGHGLRIIEELVKALDGRFEQRFGTAGSTSILVFPHSRER